MVNRRRKRRTGRMPPALARYWARRAGRNDPGPRKRRGRRRKYVRVRHVLRENRRRGSRRRSVGLPGFLSTRFLMDAGFGALGVVTPTVVTDRVLPMFGFTPTGIIRRAIQFAVPTVVLMVGGRRLLGRGVTAFVIGSYAVTTVGLVSDFAGPGLVPALSGMGRYALPAPVMGRYERAPAVLAR